MFLLLRFHPHSNESSRSQKFKPLILQHLASVFIPRSLCNLPGFMFNSTADRTEHAAGCHGLSNLKFTSRFKNY